MRKFLTSLLIFTVLFSGMSGASHIPPSSHDTSAGHHYKHNNNEDVSINDSHKAEQCCHPSCVFVSLITSQAYVDAYLNQNVNAFYNMLDISFLSSPPKRPPKV